ncbi:nucleoside hydrolase [Glaciibacter flavus]|uniref:nucleoside hydrolase n=1 Tax=Orlajensenia flava TaxID=2565934 RepID=UPI003B00A4D2
MNKKERSTMEKTRIILDTDIGTYYDDAVAVMFAAQSPELQVEGVTTCYGDTDLRAKIAAKVLKTAGREDIPVFKGIGRPMRGYGLMFGFEGEGILEPDEEITYEKQHAVDFIIETIMNNPGEIKVVTLGTVSNVAHAILKEPKVIDNIKELIIMAGVVIPIVDEKGVRRSPREEYNFNNDAIAAEIVLNSGMPISYVPCDVTLYTPLLDEDRDTIRATKTPICEMATRIFDLWPPQEKLIYTAVGIATEHTALWLHDPLVVMHAFERTLLKMFPLHIATEYNPTNIERDMYIANMNGNQDLLRTNPKKLPPNMDVALEVDGPRVSRFFTERLTAPMGNGLTS